MVRHEIGIFLLRAGTRLDAIIVGCSRDLISVLRSIMSLFCDFLMPFCEAVFHGLNVFLLSAVDLFL